MSKSLDNAICFTDSPRDIFGKTMSIPDKLIWKYFALTTPLSDTELKEIENQLKDPSVNPRNLKVRLAFELVKKYYDENTARNAEQEFENIFVKKEVPDDIPEFKISTRGRKLAEIMKETGLVLLYLS
jgi:tyrosyl-tRNA synthetase